MAIDSRDTALGVAARPVAGPGRFGSGPLSSGPDQSTRAPTRVDGRSGGPSSSGPSASDDEERHIGLGATAAAVLLSGGAAAWMAGGLFLGLAGRPLAGAGLLIGVGLVALSHRSSRPMLLQYLVLPVAAVVGGIALFTAAPADSSLGDLPSLVRSAIRTGGLGQPPIPLDPGWRFVLVVFFAVLGAAATALALGLNRANVGVFFPLAALFAAGVIQPKDGSVVAGVVALVLFVASLALAHGAELARDEATTGAFELRRLLRAGAVLPLVAVLLVLLSRAGFLFPETDRAITTPPKKPVADAIAADQVLFRVVSTESGPWRIGVLDGYRDNTFLLPPADTSRLQDLAKDGAVPEAVRRDPLVTATFTLVQAKGHEIPNLANTQRVTGKTDEIRADPRTQVLRLTDDGASGTSYTVEAAASPRFDQLVGAQPPPPAFSDYTSAPRVPAEVATLLDSAPSDPLERLTYLRSALHDKVVTAGQGEAVSVSPSRVVEMLNGSEATPFETTAAETLLARWGGIPARIGFGYFGGERVGEALEIHPRQAGTWVEAYFQGYGWVPFTSVPPKAKGSLSEGPKQASATVEPSNDLTLTLHVPVRLSTIRQLYEVVRYWLLVALPIVIGGLLLWRFFPAPIKFMRRAWRRRWAARLGPAARMAVAYSELRDVARDLNVGDVRATPVEFVDAVEPDEEHAELAWLVTRGLWGDLKRDLRVEDGDEAVLMARSVTRRLRRAQPLTARTLALGSSGSLRMPFSPDIPNLWPSARSVPAAARGRLLLGPAPKRRLVSAALVGLLAIAGVVAVSALRNSDDAATTTPADFRPLPERLTAERVGEFELRREPSAEAALAKAGRASLAREGRVFTVRRNGAVEGYLQVLALPTKLDASRKEVRSGILSETANGQFQPIRRGADRIYVSRLRDQTYRIWFSPSGDYYQLFVSRESFPEAESVFGTLLDFQKSTTPDPAPTAEIARTPVLLDPRRGGDGF